MKVLDNNCWRNEMMSVLFLLKRWNDVNLSPGASSLLRLKDKQSSICEIMQYCTARFSLFLFDRFVL